MKGIVSAGVLALSSIIFVPQNAAAQASRCDCSKVVGSCSATVKVESNWLIITSNSNSCSRVDFSINGDPQTSTVLDGVSREEWLGKKISRASVMSCQVCQDSLTSNNRQNSGASIPNSEIYNSQSSPRTQTGGDSSSAIIGTWSGQGIANTYCADFRITETITINAKVGKDTYKYVAKAHQTAIPTGMCQINPGAPLEKDTSSSGTITVNGDVVERQRKDTVLRYRYSGNSLTYESGHPWSKFQMTFTKL